MLLFLLFFQNKVSLPSLLQSVGRMHPLLLHLPIGLLVISFILWMAKNNIEEESFRKIFVLVLCITTFTASLTALMGFFLSKEGGYDEATLLKHKVLGVTTAVLSYLLLWVYRAGMAKKFGFGTTVAIAVITMIIGSHYGANLTHGEGFVFQPMQDEGEKMVEEVITDSSALYAAAIKPILRSKCFSCHNEKKKKGELVMTTEEKILQGGKNGPIWKSGDALNSHIIQNINLPEGDKKHMPPKGKPQLSQEETELLFTWIQSGADMKKRLNEYADDDTLKILAARFVNIPKEEKENEYFFEPASATLVQKLTGPFCAVFPVSINSPALYADFFVREKFDNKKLEDLLKVKEQLVVLNLNNMPVKDDDVKIINQFTNLEKLLLNNSLISNSGVQQLTNLKKLQSLSLAGMKIDGNATKYFSQLDSLKEVFIWNTNIVSAERETIQEQFPQIRFNTGYIPDEKEILVLTPPTVKNEDKILGDNEKIGLKHAVNGVTIRYTIDGSDPDSTTSPVYQEPFGSNRFVLVKARAMKPGWYSSPVESFSFFRKGFKPQRVELINRPDKKYMGKGPETIIDNEKGTAENFRDETWLGFREKPFIGVFYFDTIKTIANVTIAFNKNVPSYLLPPASIEIWGGDDNSKLILLKKMSLPVITEKERRDVRNEGVNIAIKPSGFKVYKIVVNNVQKLPAWHSGKGEKGWLFIDEIFFN